MSLVRGPLPPSQPWPALPLSQGGLSRGVRALSMSEEEGVHMRGSCSTPSRAPGLPLPHVWLVPREVIAQFLALCRCQEEPQLRSRLHGPPFIWLLSDVKDTEQKWSEGRLSGGEGSRRGIEIQSQGPIHPALWQLIGFPAPPAWEPVCSRSRLAAAWAASVSNE